MRPATLRALLTVLALVGAAACSDSGTGPDDGDDGGDGGNGGGAKVAQLQVAGGSGQQAAVSTALPLPLTVVAVDAQGAPVSGASVQFAVSQGGGSVSPSSATTDAQGRASTTWTLGATPGAHAVTATAGNASVQFSATAVPSGLYVDVVTSYENTCARTVQNRVHCWGLTQDFQSGPPRPGEVCQVDAPCVLTPQAVTNDLTFASVAPGLRHTCAVSTAGALYCWGSNASLALGIGQSDWSYRTGVPQQVDATRSWRQVTADDRFACALTADGAAYCWGKPGALGSGPPPALPVGAPAPVAGGIAFASIEAQAENVCGLTAQGELHCWGANGNGQHGTGDKVVHLTPARGGGAATYKAVSLGGAHACGIGMDDRVTCWGSNSHGQLGVNGIAESLVPVPVTTTLTFKAIAAGATHTCGIASDGAAYCWGNNLDGQLGNGFIGSGWQPRPVAGGRTFVGIEAKREYTCALGTDAKLYCWGDNTNGQLGDGTTADRVAPVLVAGQN